MNIFIIILLILAYTFIGSIVGARHHATATRKCHYFNGVPSEYNDKKIQTCWEPSWCAHITISVWFYGFLWWIALPTTAGVHIGSTDKTTRAEKRRANEIAEAKHQAELAILKRREDEELDRQLSKVTRS